MLDKKTIREFKQLIIEREDNIKKFNGEFWHLISSFESNLVDMGNIRIISLLEPQWNRIFIGIISGDKNHVSMELNCYINKQIIFDDRGNALFSSEANHEKRQLSILYGLLLQNFASVKSFMKYGSEQYLMAERDFNDRIEKMYEEYPELREVHKLWK